MMYSQDVPPMQDWDKIVAKIKAILQASTYSKEQQHAFIEILPHTIRRTVTLVNKVTRYGTTRADLEAVLRHKQQELADFDYQGRPATEGVIEIRKASKTNGVKPKPDMSIKRGDQILSAGKRGELLLEIEDIEKAIDLCNPNGKTPDFLRAGIILSVSALYLHEFQEQPTGTREGVFVTVLEVLLGSSTDPKRELKVLFSHGAVERSRMDMYSLLQVVADLRARTKNSPPLTRLNSECR